MVPSVEGLAASLQGVLLLSFSIAEKERMSLQVSVFPVITYIQVCLCWDPCLHCQSEFTDFFSIFSTQSRGQRSLFCHMQIHSNLSHTSHSSLMYSEATSKVQEPTSEVASFSANTGEGGDVFPPRSSRPPFERVPTSISPVPAPLGSRI